MKAPARLIGTLIALSLSLLSASSAQASFPGENGDIAYARPFDHGNHVFAYDTKTGKSTQLTNDSLKGDRDSTVAYDPSYGPTGKRIVFLNLVDTKDSGGRRADVYVMHSDGSHIKRLTHSPAGEYEPTFTADGKHVAYSLHGKTYLIPTNGKGRPVELTAELPNGGVSASFSSDGTKVAVWSRDGGDADIFVMDADGSNPVNITSGSSDDEYAPDFSPDGSRIAFTSDRLDSTGDVFTMAADGTDVFTVYVAADLEAGAPVYSPDGEQIALVARLTDRSAVRVSTVSAAGGQPKELKNSGPISDGASWGVK